jgi:Cyclic nucleotide-binding domain
VVTEAPAGQGFIDEGEPATCFFNVTAGTAKLFKLLPDGRRQITGFVGQVNFSASRSPIPTPSARRRSNPCAIAGSDGPRSVRSWMTSH